MLIYKSIILLPVSEVIKRANFIIHSTWQTESVYVRKCRVVSRYKHEHVIQEHVSCGRNEVTPA